MSQAGYYSYLQIFHKEDKSTIVGNLKSYVADAGESQIRAWRDEVKILQDMARQIDLSEPDKAKSSCLILEYTIPLESRRVDAIQLIPLSVVVFEFKGKKYAYQADIDQASAYARDLRAYHQACDGLNVSCYLVLTGASGFIKKQGDVEVIGPDQLGNVFKTFGPDDKLTITPEIFTSPSCYQPLPSLVKAARELFSSGSIKRIHRAASATEPTLKYCSEIIHKTAQLKRKSLILISGVPGAGKTLVGLQLAHSKHLDDLSVVREDIGKPTSPAVFLSGNGPLVEVLQYELRSAGGDGKAFVRGVHEYVKTFTKRSGLVPPQHVLIYDEAQRAFDSEQVAAKHRDMPSEFSGMSEPELFIRFAERIPEWCVVVGLIGSGQEIHIGEEAGIEQWKDAIKKSNQSDLWDVYIPDNEEIVSKFDDIDGIISSPNLELTNTIRFHLATKLYDFVKEVLEGNHVSASSLSNELEASGYNLRITHNLDLAKKYLHTRYDNHDDARYGVLASSKDKDLVNFGIPKGFKSPGEISAGKYGKWYSDPKGSPGSCTNLDTVATEFAAQGLELDACLLAWGTDFIWSDNQWSNKFSAGYKDKHRIKDALALRKNAYRVLLTRGRDGCVIYIPHIPDKMKETYNYLLNCGFKKLDSMTDDV
jgi:hypothetical protein